MRARISILITTTIFAVFAMVPAAASAQSHSVIVVLKAPTASGSNAAKRHGATATHLYTHAIRGYAATVSSSQLARIKADPAVDFVAPNRTISTTAQTTPTGILRIGSSPTRYNGVNDAVNVDVAVIDTGIDTKHSDLTVSGGYNCSSGKSYADGNGHGTHVGGTIGAKDNNLGVTGVAPGARLWAVRVLNNAGSGTTASVICGIDWVTARANVIEVANLSLGGAGADDQNCGNTNNDAMHKAICRSVAAGVTYVVAAGNETQNASLSTPAAYDEVITVSAWADFNGVAGGGAAATCRTDVDDSFASFSNFGTDVDIAAPGVCINSTWKGNSYNTISGTSMASPHVAGAAALYKAANPLATPAAVRLDLIAHADATAPSDDPDGIWEGLLSLAGWL